MKIQVQSLTKLRLLHYTVIGRSGATYSSTALSRDLKEFEFSFQSQLWMYPEAQLLAYYIHDSGEIIYDTEALIFEDEFLNKVCLNIH